MAIATDEVPKPPAAPPSKRRLRVDRRALLVFLAATGAILLLRAPSFFEPPWHTDEGIFAAVAYRVLHGGALYADAWESKPPLFLLLYTAIFKVFGVGVLPLRIAATAFALGSQWALYAVARRTLSREQALLASLICGVLLGVPFWEGTLALTEVFAILPSTLGLLLGLHWESKRTQAGSWRWLVAAGALFGVAFLLRQTAVLPGGAFVLWLLLSGRPWLKPSLLIGAGALLVVAPSVAAFALFGSFSWFLDANVLFFVEYVESGREIPIYYRPLILSPIVTAVLGLAVYRLRGQDPSWSLPALWLSMMLSAALLTGRPYSHYFLQVWPPLALMIATGLPKLSLSWRPRWEHAPVLVMAASMVALWLGVVRPEFHGDLLARHYTKSFAYYDNFLDWARGEKSTADYNHYFDGRVSLTLQLEDALEKLGAQGKEVYIWGEYPWVYPLAGVEPSSRYMTSFYVLLIPYLDVQLESELLTDAPDFIVTLQDARIDLTRSSVVVLRRYATAMDGINDVLETRYEHVGTIEKARVYRRLQSPPVIAPQPTPPAPASIEPLPAPEEPIPEDVEVSR